MASMATMRKPALSLARAALALHFFKQCGRLKMGFRAHVLCRLNATTRQKQRTELKIIRAIVCPFIDPA